MPNKSTIYSRCNPQLLKLFETAGHPAKVLCVALDYAKAQHTVLICNGLGELLKPSFALDNTPRGATQLLREVRACVKARKIRPEHVIEALLSAGSRSGYSHMNGPRKATSMRLQSLLIAKGQAPKSHLKAISMRPTCYLKATPRLPESYLGGAAE